MTDTPSPPGERCFGSHSELYARYHDEEWGVPVRDDRGLFELLVLEGAQAGLSWETVLRKRERYREVLEGFDPARVARFRPGRVERMLADPGVIRHRGKLESAVRNARAVLAVAEEKGSFSAHVWSLVDGRPLQPRRASLAEVPARTPESEALSRDLRRRGFGFVGPTTCYAFMQAAGLVNDHPVPCFRHAPVAALAGHHKRDSLHP